jgi:hypothetical protein
MVTKWVRLSHIRVRLLSVDDSCWTQSTCLSHIIPWHQTEFNWSAQTGKSDIPLTQKGEEIILQRREQVVGEGSEQS